MTTTGNNGRTLVELRKLQLCHAALARDAGELDTEGLLVAAAQYAAAVTAMRQEHVVAAGGDL